MNLGRTVSELKHTLSYRELYKWYEYYNEEPFLADRNEQQMAILSNLVASFGGSKAKVKDFMVSNKNKKEPIAREDYLKSLKSAFSSM